MCRNRPNLVRLGRQAWPISTELAETPRRFSRIWPEFDRPWAKYNRLRPNLAWDRPNLSRCGTNFDRCGPRPARKRSTLTRLRPSLGRFRPNVVRYRPELGHLWAAERLALREQWSVVAMCACCRRRAPPRLRGARGGVRDEARRRIRGLHPGEGQYRRLEAVRRGAVAMCAPNASRVHSGPSVLARGWD